MKKLIISAVLATLTIATVTPANAGGYMGRTGNDANAEQRQRENYQERLRNPRGYYPAPSYGAPYDPSFGYYNRGTSPGRTKRERDPQSRYQYCENGGWVRFGVPCPGYSAQAQTGSNSGWSSAPTKSLYNDGDYFVTEERYDDGRVVITRERSR